MCIGENIPCQNDFFDFNKMAQWVKLFPIRHFQLNVMKYLQHRTCCCRRRHYCLATLHVDIKFKFLFTSLTTI